MFHSTFHLYFGAFDLILYAAAFLVSMSVSRVICDEIDAAASQPASVAVTATMLDDNSAALTALPQSSTVIKSADSLSSNESGIGDSNASVAENNAVKPVLRLADIQQYKLHKKVVIFLNDIPFDVPEHIRRYKLRKKPVVRLENLQTFAEVIA